VISRKSPVTFEFVGGVEDEGLMGTRRILTAITLFAGVGLTPLDDLITVAIRAENRNENYSFSLQVRESASHT
jgi:hypothetical protein